MPINTNQVLSISAAERDRVNTALTAGEQAARDLTAANRNLATQTAEVARQAAEINTLKARIAVLEAQVPPVIPPVEPPPPVVTPPSGKKGLFVSNGKLYTKSGNEFIIRGIESMCGSDAFNAGPRAWCKMQKDLGANTILPLWQSSQTSIGRLTTWLDVARAEGMVVGFNVDHIPDGRAFLCRPDVVALCNKYDNIFLQCEVETGAEPSVQVWIDDVSGMVKAFRDAGHIHPVKVGSPQGGRLPRLAVENGKAVVDRDPLKNVLFTWQAYWHKTAPAGRWHYQQEARIPVSASDPGGSIEQCKRIADSGVCFSIGIDYEDDVGVTIYREVALECDKLGIGYQVWVLTGDHRTRNNILGHWNQSIESLTDTGREISTLMKVKSKLAIL